jgi:hypothetical protein
MAATQSRKMRAFMSGKGSGVLAHAQRVAKSIEIFTALGQAEYWYRTGYTERCVLPEERQALIERVGAVLQLHVFSVAYLKHDPEPQQ